MRFVCIAGWTLAAAGTWAFAYQAATPASPPQPAAATAPATGAIEGQVFNNATGAPLKKSTVRLTGLGGRLNGGMPSDVARCVLRARAYMMAPARGGPVGA